MANGVTRATQDTAGGGIILVGDPSVLVNGKPISVHGDVVTSHGGSPHDVATMVAATNGVFVGGVAIVAATNLATCGHPATGSSNVEVG